MNEAVKTALLALHNAVKAAYPTLTYWNAAMNSQIVQINISLANGDNSGTTIQL